MPTSLEFLFLPGESNCFHYRVAIFIIIMSFFFFLKSILFHVNTVFSSFLLCICLVYLFKIYLFILNLSMPCVLSIPLVNKLDFVF